MQLVSNESWKVGWCGLLLVRMIPHNKGTLLMNKESCLMAGECVIVGYYGLECPNVTRACTR